MKKPYILIQLFIIYLVIAATTLHAQTTFSKVFSSNAYRTFANGVVSTPENHLLIIGQEGDNGCIFKIDSAGNSIWSKSVTGSIFNCIIATKDSCYVIAGGNGIIKLNASGNILWAKTIKTSNRLNIVSIQQTYDSGFILTGYAGATLQIFIAKLDVNGNIQWTKLAMIENYINRGVTIKQAPDSTYYATGYFAGADDLGTNVFVTNLTQSGSVVWEKIYYSRSTRVYDFEITKTGLLIYMESRPTILVKIDFSGNVQWSKSYSGMNYDPHRGAIYNKIHKLPDGNFIFTTTGCEDNIIAKIDSLGNVIGSKKLIVLISEAIQTKDNGYIIVGNGPWCGENPTASGTEIGVIKIATIGNSEQFNSCVINAPLRSGNAVMGYMNWLPFTYLTHTASDTIATPVVTNLALIARSGCVTTESSGINEYDAKNEITILPNPFTTHTVLYATTPFNDATLTVYNSIGQQVRQLNRISGKSIAIERGDLVNGLYFIQITSPAFKGSQNNIITKKLLIINN